MIIDYKQKKDGLEISYVSPNQSILVENIPLKNGYYNYVQCDEFDKQKCEGLTSFYGNPIKKEPSKYFTHHNINNFFGSDIPKDYPEVFQKINNVIIPKPFSFDIETDIDPLRGYADQKDPFNPVRSISFTDINMQTLLFIVKNPEHSVFNDLDNGYIENILKDSLGEYWNKYNFEFKIKQFDSEKDLLIAFLDAVNKYFHLLIGWNCIDYDWTYIYGRCERLGIDIKKASPTHNSGKKRFEIKSNIYEVVLPTHRIISIIGLLFDFQNSIIKSLLMRGI